MNQAPEYISYQASFGINTFVAGKEPKKGVTVDKYIAAVKAARSFAVIGYEWLKESKKLELLKTEPAIIACLIADEPDAGESRLSAEELEKRCKEVKSINPVILNWINLSSGFFGGEAPGKNSTVYYKKVCGLPEILSFSLYPISMWGKNTERVGAGVKKLRELSEDRVPVMACFECGLLPSINKEGHEPATEDINVELWSGLINGARGLGYFMELKSGLAKKNAKLNSSVESLLNRQHSLIQEIAPVLVSKDVFKGRFEIQSGGLDEENLLVKETAENIYAFFLNPTKNSKKVKVGIKFTAKSSIFNLYGINRTLVLDKDNIFADVIEPGSVHIYELSK